MFSICIWRNLALQIVGRSHLSSMHLRILMRGLSLKTVACSFSVVRKIFEKEIIGPLMTLRNMAYFLTSSRVSCLLSQLHISWKFHDKTAKAFNVFRATRVVTLNVSLAFGRVRHTFLLHKLKSYGVLDQVFDLILSFFSKGRLCFWMFASGKGRRTPFLGECGIFFNMYAFHVKLGLNFSLDLYILMAENCIYLGWIFNLLSKAESSSYGHIIIAHDSLVET